MSVPSGDPLVACRTRWSAHPRRRWARCPPSASGSTCGVPPMVGAPVAGLLRIIRFGVVRLALLIWPREGDLHPQGQQSLRHSVQIPPESSRLAGQQAEDLDGLPLASGSRKNIQLVAPARGLHRCPYLTAAPAW